MPEPFPLTSPTRTHTTGSGLSWEHPIYGYGGGVTEPQPQRPTATGFVDGIVALDPMEIQCRECGRVKVHDERSALVVFLSGWEFIARETPAPVRRCPECVAAKRREMGVEQ